MVVDQLHAGRGGQSATRDVRFLCLNHGVRALTVQTGLQCSGVAWKNQFRRYFLTVAAGVFIHPGHGVGIDRTCDLAGALDQPCLLCAGLIVQRQVAPLQVHLGVRSIQFCSCGRILSSAHSRSA